MSPLCPSASVHLASRYKCNIFTDCALQRRESPKMRGSTPPRVRSMQPVSPHPLRACHLRHRSKPILQFPWPHFIPQELSVRGPISVALISPGAALEGTSQPAPVSGTAFLPHMVQIPLWSWKQPLKSPFLPWNLCCRKDYFPPTPPFFSVSLP